MSVITIKEEMHSILVHILITGKPKIRYVRNGPNSVTNNHPTISYYTLKPQTKCLSIKEKSGTPHANVISGVLVKECSIP